MAIQSDNYEEGTCGIRCLLKFEYTPNYPEELPVITIDEIDNLDPNYVEELEQFLQNEVYCRIFFVWFHKHMLLMNYFPFLRVFIPHSHKIYKLQLLL